jgi:hypothetical protein
MMICLLEDEGLKIKICWLYSVSMVAVVENCEQQLPLTPMGSAVSSHLGGGSKGGILQKRTAPNKCSFWLLSFQRSLSSMH